MIKTANEFLEELKQDIDRDVDRLSSVKRTEYGDGSFIAYVDIQRKIKQFQAEQNKDE